MRISDWSSDVCSSDLPEADGPAVRLQELRPPDRRHLRQSDRRRRRFFRPDPDGDLAGGEHAAVAAVFLWRDAAVRAAARSEEHTSELQSLMRISYAVFCLKKKKTLQCRTTRKTR